jgi:hypothetical protein
LTRPLALALAAVAAALLAFAPAAMAKDRVLTLYSPKISSEPYVHDTHSVRLRANGREAPAEGGFVTGFVEQVLVDSKNPKAKPLPNSKMMIHHFLYFAPGRIGSEAGSCWAGAGFISGRGEEHPSGKFSHYTPPDARAKYGIPNKTADGSAPEWRLVAMVMNHYQRPKDFYVRTKVRYTTEEREPVNPVVVGDCATLRNQMAYDVPGGGGRGSNFVNQSNWTAPFSGRILLAANHQHGGGKYQTFESQTCNREVFRAPVYHGTKRHIYNRIRPILHEPGPIGTGAYGSVTGIPVREGEQFSRAAVHDNENLHVASMGFWIFLMVRDDSVGDCDPMPSDVRELNRPKRFDRTPNHGLVVPQLFKPDGAFSTFSGDPLSVGDRFFRPDRVRSNVGETVRWSFTGNEPHSVTVANGPRGFSSLYTGERGGGYEFTPTVPGTYRLTCLIHPTTMGQDLVVR